MEEAFIEKILKEASRIPFKKWTEKDLSGFGNREYSTRLKKGFRVYVYTEWITPYGGKVWSGDSIYGLRITKQEFFEEEILKVQTNRAYPLFKKLKEERERMLQEKSAKSHEDKIEKLSHLLKILR